MSDSRLSLVRLQLPPSTTVVLVVRLQWVCTTAAQYYSSTSTVSQYCRLPQYSTYYYDTTTTHHALPARRLLVVSSLLVLLRSSQLLYAQCQQSYDYCNMIMIFLLLPQHWPKTSLSFLMDCAGFIMMRMKRRVTMTWEKKVRARRRQIELVLNSNSIFICFYLLPPFRINRGRFFRPK